MSRCIACAVTLWLAAVAALFPAPATALDTLPPVIVGTPTIQPSTIDVSDGSKSVRVEVHLADPDGVFGVIFGFVHENEPELILELAGGHLVNGTPQDGTWQGDVTISPTVAGEVFLYIEAYDTGFVDMQVVTAVPLTILGGDDVAPELDGAVTLEPDHVDLAGGAVDVTIDIPVRDDGSGIQSIDTWFNSGDTLSIGGLEANLIDGDSHQGLWRAVVPIPANATAAGYTLILDVRDMAGNDVRFEGPILVVGGSDSAPPMIAGPIEIDPVQLDPTAGDGAVTVLIPVADPSGVDFVSAGMNDSSGTNVAFEFGMRIDGDSLAGTWRVNLVVAPSAPAGPYDLVVYAQDLLSNGTDHHFERVFTVVRGGDVEAPTVVPPILVMPNPVDLTTEGATVTVRGTVRDTESGVAIVSAILRNNHGSAGTGELMRIAGDSLDGTWEGTVVIPPVTPGGMYEIVLRVSDAADNMAARVTGDSLMVRCADSEPPTLVGTATLDPTTVNVTSGARAVQAEFTLADAGSGVATARAELRSIGGAPGYEAMAERLLGDSLAGTWRAPFTIPATAPAIVLALWIVTEDRFGNEATIETGALLDIERDQEARAVFRVDMRGVSLAGLFRSDGGMMVRLDLFDAPSPMVLAMSDANLDSIYEVESFVRVGRTLRYAFVLDPNVGGSAGWLYERNARNGGRELRPDTPDPVTLPAVLFDDRSATSIELPYAEVIARSFFEADPDSQWFNDGLLYTDLTLAGVRAPIALVAVRLYVGGLGGGLPAGIAVLSSAVHWGLSALTNGEPLAAELRVGWNLYGGVVDPGALRFLHRASANDPWVIVPTLLEPERGSVRGALAPVEGEWTLGSTSPANSLAPEPPAIPGSPSPPDSSIRSDGELGFHWLPSAGAISYEAWLWPDTLAQPGSPTFSYLNEPSFQTVTSFPLLSAWRWQAAARNRAGAAVGPVWLFHIDRVPDLELSSIEAPPEAFGGQAIEIRWTAENHGSGATDAAEWTDYVVFSSDSQLDFRQDRFLGTFQNPSYLRPGESYRNIQEVTLPTDMIGEGFLFIVLNGDRRLVENGPGQNIGSSSIRVLPARRPDLAATQLTMPDRVFSGGKVRPAWRVTNRGPAPFVDRQPPNNVLADGLYLSADTLFDGQADRYLSSAPGPVTLAPDSSYSTSIQFSLPDSIFGDFTLFLVTDALNQVVEEDEFLNNRRHRPLTITLTPPPDLTVTTITAPATGASGKSLVVGWQGANIGPGPVPENNSWSDRLLLVPDNGANTDSTYVLAALARVGPFGPDSTYEAGTTVRLPDGLDGPFHLRVVSDWDDRVFEYLFGDNNGRDLPFQVRLSPAPDLVPQSLEAPAEATAGSFLELRWSVTNVGVDTARAGWIDRIHLLPTVEWDSSAAVAIGAATNRNDLAPGGIAASFAVGEIPPIAAGTWHLFISTDADGRLYEHAGEANNHRAAGSIVIRSLPVDLVARDVTVPATAASGQSIPVGWTVTNDGAGRTTAAAWNDAVFLSADDRLDVSTDRLIGTFRRSGVLGGDAGYDRSVNVRLPNGISGRYRLLVRADDIHEVPEGNEANNVMVAPNPLDITLSPPADLRIDGLTVNASPSAGQPIPLGFTIRNAGPGATDRATWYQSVYLSKNGVADQGDIVLGTFPHVGILDGGAGAPMSIAPSIPAWLSGAWYLIVTADSRGEVYEQAAESNNAAAMLVVIDLPPPTDLVVHSASIDPEADSGDSVTVAWVLENRGTHPARGLMTDAVYVSPDSTPSWDLEDPLVGTMTRSINLAGGASMTLRSRIAIASPMRADAAAELMEPLPGLKPGLYRAIIRTNIRGTIRESDNDNNVGTSVEPVRVDVPLLAFDTPTSVRLVDGGNAWFRIMAPDGGGAIAVQLDGMGSAARHELFSRFAEPPGRSGYDHAGSLPFSSDQDLLIPAAAPGTHYLLAFGDQVSAGGEMVTLTARRLAFGIDDVSPDHGGQGGDVTLRLTGTVLAPEIQPTLVQGSTRIEPTRVFWSNPTRVFATFHLGAAPVGAYDLVAEQVRGRHVITGDTLEPLLTIVDSSRVVRSAAFRVEPPDQRPIDLRVSTPPAVRIQQSFEMAIEATNTSNNDVRAPLVVVLGAPDFRKGSARSGDILRGPRLFLLAAPEGPAGLLAPGVTARIEVEGLAPFVPGLMDVHVLPVEDRLLSFDFDRELAESGIDPASPLWSEAVALLRARGLSTWDDYADLLAETASARDARIETPRDADALLMLAIEDAQNRILHPEVANASPTTPGWSDPTSASVGGFGFTGAVGTRWSQQPTGCSDLETGLDRAVMSQVHQVFSGVGANTAAAHMANYLTTGADVTYGPGSPVSEAARKSSRSNRSLAMVHDRATQQLHEQLKAYVEATGCGVNTIPLTYFRLTVRPLDFYRADAPGAIVSFDPTQRDLIMAFGGMRRAWAIPIKFDFTAKSTSACGHECDKKVCHVAYSGVIQYHFQDDYEFSNEDCRSSTFERSACNLQKCGKARPFVTEIVIEMPFSGRFVIPDPGGSLQAAWGPDVAEVASIASECDPERERDPSPIDVLGAIDPNDIIGPAGTGDERWVARTDVLPYKIRFENDPMKANAPAQVVTITQTLDPDLDGRTFRLGRFGFGSFQFVPPPNAARYETRLDVRDSLGVFVDVTAGIDITTDEVFWTFRSIDPVGGDLPLNPASGFLPVNDELGHGSGFVSYTVRALPGTRTGDRVEAAASIIFDQNAPLGTPMIANAIDADPPRSRVRMLPATLDSTRINLEFDGGDSTGSGIESVRLFVAEDDAPFMPVPEEFQVDRLGFDGRFGHTYRFYIEAVDRTGNRERVKSAAEATVRLDPVTPAPRPFTVHPNVPNPFRATTSIPFEIPGPGQVGLKVFDVAGRLLRTIPERAMEAGSHAETLQWEGRASGLYFVELTYRDATGRESRLSSRVVCVR